MSAITRGFCVLIWLMLSLGVLAADDGRRAGQDDSGFEFIPPPKDVAPPATDGEAETPAPNVPIDIEDDLVKGVDTLARLDNRLKPVVIGIDSVPGSAGVARDRRTFRFQVNPILQIPFLEEGAMPNHSEFKFGRLYFDATALTLSALYSDNINQTRRAPEDDLLFSTSLGLDVLFELTENSYLRINGALVWFPFEGVFGVDGYGAHDIYALGFEDLFSAGLLLDGRLASWDIIFQDELVFHDSTNATGISGDAALFDDNDFTEETDAGVHSFSDDFAENPVFEGTDPADQSTEVVNTASLTARRELARNSELSLTAFYRNIWYINEPRNMSDAITRQYGLSAEWVSKRDDWRFNPLAYYTQVWNNVDQGWMYVARVGGYGPVTDQIDVYADIGVGRARHFGINDELLHRLSVKHVIGPLSRQEWLFEKRIQSRARTLEEGFRYRFQQIFGPRARGSLFAGWRESAGYIGDSYHQDYWGAMLFIQMTPVIGLLQQYTATRTDYINNPGYADTDAYRATLTYIISKHSYFELSYEHRSQIGDEVFARTFRENLYVLSWVYLL